MSAIQCPVGLLEIAIAIALAGSFVVSCSRDPMRAWKWGFAFAGAVLTCSLAACVDFYIRMTLERGSVQSFSEELVGTRLFAVDELNAPLIPMLALIHFLTALATGRTKMRRFSLSWSLASLAFRLAMLGCTASWTLIALLVMCLVPPYLELRNRNKPTRVYVLHMSLFALLLAVGWVCTIPAEGYREQNSWAAIPLFVAILIRCGIFPLHCWLPDWFEHASFGNALLFATPLIGVYATVRLVLPIAPDWMLQCLAAVSLLTAVYAAGMAIVQESSRRFFAYLFLSHASLILVGLELHTRISLTGALALWMSVSLSLTGFGLTLRALEARFGNIDLVRYHGLYNQAPALAICFLLTGLASVGFPGTLGFVAGELVIDGAVQSNLLIGLGMIAASALNGIAVVRVYSRLFMGPPHVSSVPLGIGLRERVAVLIVIGLILGGGLYPQPGIASRYRAALSILRERDKNSEHPTRTAKD
jgi:NADH-quinone oxidoreductase subunit M